MRLLKAAMLLVIALLIAMDGAEAQSTTGTIRGHVADGQGLPLPGVVVTVTSSSLQGTRSATTEANGDYLIPLLPSGAYLVTFDLQGFEKREERVTLAPTQNLPVVVTLGPAAVSESVEVVAQTADVLMGTTQVAANFKQAMIANLPTNRDINATLLLAPAVHATGPGGNYSIAGSMSFENLFLVNGVTVNENLRGQAENLYIEDAIQETTIAAAGISAEYGRFGGGVVNVVTKSGGNLFGGSFRETLHNDKWRALVTKRPGDTFATDTKLDDVVPTHEYTFGGPVLRDKLWFFTAGRLQTQTFNRQLVITNIPYVYTLDSKRFEGKGTYALTSTHRFQGAFTKILSDQQNNTFSTGASMDLNSLENRSVPEDLFTLNYTGVVRSNLFVEGRYSARNLSIIGTGSPFTDRIRGTLLVEGSQRRWWSATFCSAPTCPGEQRDNQDFFTKGSYFLSKPGIGSHNTTFGVDVFNDMRVAQNYQSGSNFRILNADALVVNGTELYPRILNNATIRWQPIFVESQGTNFRTISAFVNDSWAVSPRLTANVGLRLDKNQGRNGAGQLVAKDAAISPRLGLVWDATGDQRWLVTASAGKYVASVLNSIADLTSPGGNADQYNFNYGGPPINPDGTAPLVPTADALAQLFAWFDANGGTGRAQTGTPQVRGVSSIVSDSLKSPNNWEYAAGVARQFGTRLAIRHDFVYRNYNDFYAVRTDMSTGRTTDTRPYAPPTVAGRQYDLAVIENTNVLERQYAGLTSQITYRQGTRFDVGSSYTLSRAWGNVDGETLNGGPLANDQFQYPEYKQAAWYYPEGDLSVDQRHRLRLWMNYGVPRVRGLIVSLLQTVESGAPYGALAPAGIDARPHITNPGYLSPPDGTQTQYFYTARDAFRTEGQRRLDWSAIYSHRVPRTRAAELYGQIQVLNVFNQAQLCGCGASVFANGGNVQTNYIDATVRTAVTTPASYQTFNPFTTAPVEGVHWAKGPAFGAAVNRFAYTTPRMLRLTFGIRF